MDGKVTLSTVHRAKGNEAAAVIVTGIDALYPLRDSRTGRNRIFTAFTRRTWLRVSGVGDVGDFFLRELSVALRIVATRIYIPRLKPGESIATRYEQARGKIEANS